MPLTRKISLEKGGGHEHIGRAIDEIAAVVGVDGVGGTREEHVACEVVVGLGLEGCEDDDECGSKRRSVGMRMGMSAGAGGEGCR